MAIRLPLASRNAAATAVADRADAGSAAGRLRIYTGAQPAAGGDAATGTLLADVALQDPAFAAASGGSKTLNDPAAITGVAAGTAGWFRILDSDLNPVLDGSVGTSGADLNLTNTNIAVGQTVDISSGGTVTMPAG